MDIKTLRTKTAAELRKELLALSKERFNLRMQTGMEDSPRPHLHKEVRRNIARVKTVLSEKEKAGE